MLHYHNPHEEEGNTNFPGSTTPSWESRATPSHLGDESPRVTNVLDFDDEVTEISSLERIFYKSQDDDPDSYGIYLKFYDGKRIDIFQTYHEYTEIIDAFNLFIKGKNTTPGIIN